MPLNGSAIGILDAFLHGRSFSSEDLLQPMRKQNVWQNHNNNSPKAVQRALCSQPSLQRIVEPVQAPVGCRNRNPTLSWLQDVQNLEATKGNKDTCTVEC